jgi:hypothetical protein
VNHRIRKNRCHEHYDSASNVCGKPQIGIKLAQSGMGNRSTTVFMASLSKNRLLKGSNVLSPSSMENSCSSVSELPRRKNLSGANSRPRKSNDSLTKRKTTEMATFRLRGSWGMRAENFELFVLVSTESSCTEACLSCDAEKETP